MSAEDYLSRAGKIIADIARSEGEKIKSAGEAFARSIQAGGRVYLFGSGHSVLPVLDIFPRYGSFVGFYPIYDPRLMWFNVVGPGGARELLWLERREGYVAVVLESYQLEPRDCILIFSHGGLNAAPVEMAIEAKKKGLTVVSVSSHQNRRQAKSTHSSGKTLADASDIAIDSWVPPEDALISVEGMREKFAAGSTLAAVAIAMSLVAETGTRLVKDGARPGTFVSPNVGLPADHNQNVCSANTSASFGTGNLTVRISKANDVRLEPVCDSLRWLPTSAGPRLRPRASKAREDHTSVADSHAVRRRSGGN